MPYASGRLRATSAGKYCVDALKGKEGDMAAKFEARLTDKVDRAAGVRSYRFVRPDDFSYVAGQFFFITLPGDGSLRKPFSFSSSPTEDYLEFTTRLSGSDFKNALDELPLGRTPTIEGPYGRFTLRDGDAKVVFLAGGIGITPLRSMTKYVTDESLDVDMVLIYSNRSEAGIAFREDFDEMSESAKLKVVHCLSEASDDWAGYRGRVTRDVIEAEVPDSRARTFYVCGPPGMVDGMRSVLAEMDLEAERIVVENFAGY